MTKKKDSLATSTDIGCLTRQTANALLFFFSAKTQKALSSSLISGIQLQLRFCCQTANQSDRAIGSMSDLWMWNIIVSFERICKRKWMEMNGFSFRCIILIHYVSLNWILSLNEIQSHLAYMRWCESHYICKCDFFCLRHRFQSRNGTFGTDNLICAARLRFAKENKKNEKIKHYPYAFHLDWPVTAGGRLVPFNALHSAHARSDRRNVW